jgi:hypothetical protein
MIERCLTKFIPIFFQVFDEYYQELEVGMGDNVENLYDGYKKIYNIRNSKYTK